MLRSAALLSVLALAAGVSACGSDDAQLDAQPRTTPDLIAPEDVTLAEPSTGTTPDGSSTTSTTGTAATPATPPADGSGGAAAPADPATPAPSGGTPAPATPAPSTGNNGAGTGGAQEEPQGGGNADPGGFSDFCAQNPGACGTDGR